MSHVDNLRALGITDEALLGQAAVLDMKDAARDAEKLSEVLRLRNELAEARKEAADARAERIIIESALVDALGALQFYARQKHWEDGLRSTVGLTTIERDVGSRARVTLNRLFDRLIAFARVQALREPGDVR